MFDGVRRHNLYFNFELQDIFSPVLPGLP